MKPPIKCAISYLTLQSIATFHLEGIFSTFEAREWGLIRNRHDVWLWGRAYRAVAMRPWLWTNEANRKRTERIFSKCRSKRWKNCIRLKVSMQKKHTNINHMKWWGVLSDEYLAPSHRKFPNSFSIDVAGMGQRRRGFEPKWYQGGVVAQGGVNHVS